MQTYANSLHIWPGDFAIICPPVCSCKMDMCSHPWDCSHWDLMHRPSGTSSTNPSSSTSQITFFLIIGKSFSQAIHILIRFSCIFPMLGKWFFQFYGVSKFHQRLRSGRMPGLSFASRSDGTVESDDICSQRWGSKVMKKARGTSAKTTYCGWQ